jgi:hypothetical protein
MILLIKKKKIQTVFEEWAADIVKGMQVKSTETGSTATWLLPLLVIC